MCSCRAADTKRKGLRREAASPGMASDTCDGCGDSVSIGGGIANIWTQESRPTEGIILELGDGTEHLLCYDCIDRLPDDREVTEADVEDLA